MSSIGNKKELLLNQIEKQKNKVTIDQILKLLNQYDDLTIEDFRGRIPDELFTQLRNPQESKAWNTIITASPEGEQGLKDLIEQITDFIKKYPESEKLNRAEILKKGFETDLISMKLWEELAKATPSSQREIGHEIQRLTDFIDKYPNFSRIEDARRRREELENRIDNSLWQRAWAQIAAANPTDRSQCESLLKDVDHFIEEYPISPKLGDAISLKSELETRISGFEGDNKALDLEWENLTKQQPTTVEQYQSLVAKVSDFAARHPQWSNIGEADALLHSLKLQLDTLLEKKREEAEQRVREEQRLQDEEARKRRQEEEERRRQEERAREEEKKWMAEWDSISKTNPVSTADKQALVDRLSSFINTYTNCSKINEAKSLKARYENELRTLSTNNTIGDIEDKKKKSKLPLIIGIVALILIGCLIAFFTMGSEDKKEESGKVKTEQIPTSEPTDLQPVEENESDLPTEPSDKPKTDKPTDNPTVTEPAPEPQKPAAPQVPDWVKSFDKIDRNVKGGVITKIDYTPDKYSPKEVVITVRYPDFSKASMTAADHETVRNLKKEVITKYRKQSQVDIKVVALDVNNQPIE